MRRELITRISAAALALVVGTGLAAAQGRPTPPPVQQGSDTRQVSLSPAEMVAQGEAFIARMDAARETVKRQLESARKQRDVVKTLCLNDKLNQLDVAVRSARERKSSLTTAAQRNDADLANHEFTVLGVLRERANTLTAEANQCIGMGETFIGENAEVTVTIDPSLGTEDPSSFQTTNVIVQPPACTSCTQ